MGHAPFWAYLLPADLFALHMNSSKYAAAAKVGRSMVGSTLLEVMVSVGIAGVFLSGIFGLQWRTMQYFKCAQEAAQGSRVLGTLAEAIRTSTWTQVTSAGSAGASGSGVTNILQNAGTPSTMLNNCTETIQVSAYPTNSAVTPLIVTQSSTGVINVAQQPSSSLPSQPTVRVDLTIAWSTTFNAMPHTRMLSLIVSQNGILGRYQ
jgi:Tfp pilus assembly protein PilV